MPTSLASSCASRYHAEHIACACVKRVPLLLPPEMLAWIDAKTRNVENRTTFIRRLIAEAMKQDNAGPQA
ncbi:hypothetical protein EBT31_05655 [bacterium]|nr:hypothetical protein [bacterium]